MLCHGCEPFLPGSGWVSMLGFEILYDEKVLQMNNRVFLVRFKDSTSFYVVVKKVGLQFDGKPVVVNPCTSDTRFCDIGG